MSEMVPWIGAQAEGIEGKLPNLNAISAGRREKRPLRSRASAPELGAAGFSAARLPTHQFPAEVTEGRKERERDLANFENLGYAEMHALEVQMEEERWEERRRERELQRQLEMDREEDLRRYRGRTVKLLRRYLRTAIEAGRLPSVLGSAFFRSGVTCYSVVTFEDRVIFVRDMEICLEKLDDLSREILTRCVLQGHDLRDTAKLTHGTMRTTRRNIPAAIDAFSEILLNMGLLEELFSNRENSCQEGKSDEFPASDCEQGK